MAAHMRLVIVTGAPRSGIEILAQQLYGCGGFFGRVTYGLVGAPGNFEHTAIMEGLQNPFIEGLKGDPRGFGKIPDIATCQKVAEKLAPQWREVTEKLLISDGAGEEDTICLASQSACLIWPIWRVAFPEATWLVLRRKDADIARSCLQTGWCLPRRSEQGWLSLVSLYRARFQEIQHHARYCECWLEKYLQGDMGYLNSVIESVGLTWQIERVKEYARPILWSQGIFVE